MVEKRSRKILLIAASRAAKQLVGYFCGYTTKRQVVGKYELDQSANSMNLLSESLKKECGARQLARVTNRMLSDLQCRVARWSAPTSRNGTCHNVEYDNAWPSPSPGSANPPTTCLFTVPAAYACATKFAKTCSRLPKHKMKP